RMRPSPLVVHRVSLIATLSTTPSSGVAGACTADKIRTRVRIGGGMGGDGRGEVFAHPGVHDSSTASGPSVEFHASPLFGPPGPALAAAVESAVDPASGSWPVGTLPSGASPEPWAQVIHAVVSSRRLAGWA